MISDVSRPLQGRSSSAKNFLLSVLARNSLDVLSAAAEGDRRQDGLDALDVAGRDPFSGWMVRDVEEGRGATGVKLASVCRLAGRGERVTTATSRCPWHPRTASGWSIQTSISAPISPKFPPWYQMRRSACRIHPG